MTALRLGSISIPTRQLTRHVGIFGATGTGKTNTASALIERAPCPVLAFDAKGDLERAGRLIRPVIQLDRMSPDMLNRALNLSDAQGGVVQMSYAYAEDSGRALHTLDDLRAILPDVPDSYGLASPQSVQAVMRSTLRLSRAAPWAFGVSPPPYRNATGLNVVGCQHIIEHVGLYGAYVASVLDEIYRTFDEVGDGPARLIVMIDESHLLFDSAPAPLVKRLEQITRLIRSKGVGLVYVTQAPADLPDAIGAQLGTRFVHGLRGTTPAQMNVLKHAAQSLGVRPQDLQALGIGDAFVSVPDAQGVTQAARLHKLPRSKLASGSVPWQPPPKPPPKAPGASDKAGAPKPRPWWLTPMMLAVSIWAAILLSA